MKRWIRNSIIAAGAAALVLTSAIGVAAGPRPFLGPRSRDLRRTGFARTPARLARGEYLVEAVSGCMDCHSPHDWTKHDALVLPGRKGSGQVMSAMLKDLPGRIVAPNLTPDAETGSGTWSDDALARAIREGIGHDGRALFPMMPYMHFRAYPDEDVASIVVYIRSLAPVHNALPVTEVAFPVKYLMRSAPEPLSGPVPEPDLSQPVKRGAFLVNAAACADCHTPQKNGQPIAGMEFAGGFVLEGPFGRVASANLTTHPSGIPYYDEAQFVQTLRTGYVGARKLNQIMPWHVFRNMTDQDLKAIYAFLKTLPPVAHRTDNTEAPGYCPLDKSVHGLGAQNAAK
jgi:cytochrome c553